MSGPPLQPLPYDGNQDSDSDDGEMIPEYGQAFPEPEYESQDRNYWTEGWEGSETLPAVQIDLSSMEEKESKVENWDHYYRTFQDIDSFGLKRPFGAHRSEDDANRMKHYKRILFSKGYTFNTNVPLYKGADNLFDHQVWVMYNDVESKGHWFRKFYACKIAGYKYFHDKSKDMTLESVSNSLLSESRILIQCDHQNVVKVFDYIGLEDQDNRWPYNFVALIMEFMDGNLAALIEEFKDRALPDRLIKKFIKDVAFGLEYLHNPEHLKKWDRQLIIVHMALRPANILYKKFGLNLVFKLADFEESYVYDVSAGEEDFVPDRARSGVYRHMFSDRILSVWPLPPKLRTRPLDIYSLGICLYYSYMYLYDPVRQANRKTKLQSLFELDVWHLYHGMTEPNRKLRFTIAQVLAHPWLKGDHSIKPVQSLK